MTDRNLRRLALGVLIPASLGFGLLIVPAGLACLMAPMAFDGGISGAALLFVGCLLSFPLVVLASILSSWILYRRGVYRAAIGLSLLPALNVLVVAAMFAFES